MIGALLFDAWKLADDEPELTVMQVSVEGIIGGLTRRYTWDLYDEFDAEAGISSMARTTGFPAAIMARMLARNEISLRGIIPPENIGAVEPLFERVMKELAQRNVRYQEAVEDLPKR